jgi:hypothetical protein
MSNSDSFEKLKDIEWLKILYAETWKQYVHEDTIAQTRGTIFTAILAAIVALLGALSIQVVKIPCSTLQNHAIAPGIVILGLFWFLASFVMDRLTTSFHNVTQAGRFYVNARGAGLRMIEAAAGLGVFGPATFEDAWREKSKGHIPGTDVTILVGVPEFEKLTVIPAYNFAGGFRFFSEVVGVFRKINAFLRYSGIMLILVGLFGQCLNLQSVVPLCQ